MSMRRGLTWAITAVLAALVAAPSWAAPAPQLRNGRPGATADERQLGALAAEQLIQQFGLVQDEGLQARLDGVARTLTRYVPSGDSYRFRILKSDDVNAMTTPDGQVFVTRTLVRVFRNDDDLAGVLAHEISHVLLGHTARPHRAGRGEAGRGGPPAGPAAGPHDPGDLGREEALGVRGG